LSNAVSRKGDAEMRYCHTKSGYTIELFLPILVMAALCAGCASTPVDFGPGLVKFDTRQYDEAALVFQEIIDKDSEKTNQARFYIGECYRYQSRYDRAIGMFQMIVNTEPPRSYLANQARDRISQIREGRRDIERLSALFRSSKPGDEKAADYLMERGMIYETKLGDYENAIKAYRQVVDEFPGTEKAAQAQINIGNIYFYRLYDYARGWPEFKKVNAENYPDLSYRVSEVESMLRETNRIRQEISVETQFIQRSQKRRIPNGKIARGYDIYGVMENHVAEAYMAIAKAWRQLRNYPRVLEVYRTFIEQFPLVLRQVAESRYGIGEIYQEWGRYVEAVDAYETFMKFHPTHYRRHEALYNVAGLYETMGDYGRAYEMYKEYCDMFEDASLIHGARLKLQKYESDEDQDGFPYYMEYMGGTSDNDPNEYPR
jgi:tetratricopeptide (TPR) repeat protein